MRAVCRREGERLTVSLSGEVDEHSSNGLRARLDGLINDREIRRIVFDLSGVTLMDSSGIGVILGRYRRLSERGGSMDIRGASGSVERVLRVSGVYKLCTKGGARK